MARIDWRKKMRRIPAKVQIAPKIWYDVVWQKDMTNTKGTELAGTTDYDNKIITIDIGMSPKLTVTTYLHECFHAFSHEYNIKLTENQILGLENIIPYLDDLFEK